MFQVWYRCLLHLRKLKILRRASSAIIGTFPLPAGIFFSRELMVKDFKWWTKSSKSKKKLEFLKDKSYLVGICENLKYHASLVGWNWTSHFAFQIIWTQKYWMPLSWLAASLWKCPLHLSTWTIPFGLPFYSKQWIRRSLTRNSTLILNWNHRHFGLTHPRFLRRIIQTS